MISSLDANAKTEKQKMLDEEYFYALAIMDITFQSAKIFIQITI